MSNVKNSEATTIIPVVHADQQPVLCEFHPNAIVWEVVDGPYRGIRGCDACLHPEIGALARDKTRLFCVEEGRRIDVPAGIKDLPLFGLGRVVATPGALFTLGMQGENPDDYIQRHVTGDWGALDEEDQRANEIALREGLRVLSAYQVGGGKRIYVITEWDRSATTLLLPAEY